MTVNIITAAIISVLSLLIAYVCIPQSKYRFAFALVVFFAVVLRFITVFYIYRNGTEAFGTDGLLYHNEGIKIMGQLARGAGVSDISYSYTLYTALIGYLYYFIGINRYFASYVNIIFALISGLILLRIAINHRYSLLNAMIICASFLYFPNLILWTADTRKESLLILVFFLSWLSIQKLVIGINRQENALHSFMRVLFICFLMWVGTLIRIYIFIPLMLGTVTSLIILYRKKRGRFCLIFAATVVAGAVIILVTVLYPLSTGYHAVKFSQDESSNVAEDVNGKIGTIYDIVSRKNILKAIAGSLLLPNPARLDIQDINYSGKLRLVVQLDMIAWYLSLFLILAGIYNTFRKKDSYFLGLLSFLISYMLINAFIAENVADTLYRYRAAVVGLAVLFIDGGMIRRILGRFGNFMKNDHPVSVKPYSQYEVLSMVQNRKNFM